MPARLDPLICAACRAQTTGRQWWNQRPGIGLCPSCATRLERRHGIAIVHLCYGLRGYHYALPVWLRTEHGWDLYYRGHTEAWQAVATCRQMPGRRALWRVDVMGAGRIERAGATEFRLRDAKRIAQDYIDPSQQIAAALAD